MRRITSAIALAGVAGGIVLGAAGPAMASTQSRGDKAPATNKQFALALTQQAMQASLPNHYSPMPPRHPNVYSPVYVTCNNYGSAALLDLSWLAGNFCNVANGPGAAVSGGIGIDTVNILP